MKKILLLFLTLIALNINAKNAALVSKIDPPCWWTDMADDTLQLMVYGNNISEAEVKVTYPGVSLLETVRPDSPDYLLLYLLVDDSAKPGSVVIDFKIGKKKQSVDYQLKKRTGLKPEFEGFDAADVLYLVMPDRFADGDPKNNVMPEQIKFNPQVNRSEQGARHGGDIQGMVDHLDYIDSLGVTAIWVNPVLENDMPGGSYHGYATTDFYRIDPRFGTNEQWNSFIKDANARGMKVVMDMIFNHCGSEHPWLKNPPYKNWFNFPDTTNFVQTNYRLSTLHDPYVSDYDLAKTVDGWFVREMPDLNQRNPHLLKYLIQNSIWWIENSKISGIRMDTYPYADMVAMGKWIDAVEKEYPGFNIVGECWYANEGGEAFWQRGSKVNPIDPRLKTVMDFKISIDAPKAFGENTDPWNGLNKMYDHLALDYLFPNPQNILTFLDNHDTDRFLREMPSDLGSWKQAQTFLLTSRGIPQIYYGTELLMNGTRTGGDGNVRKDMPGGFPGDTTSVFTRQGRSDLQNEAYDFLSKLLKWRKSEVSDIIAKGKLKHFMPFQGLYVYERSLDGKRVIILMNGTDSILHVDMKQFAEILPAGTSLPDFLSGKKITIDNNMAFAPRQILILEDL